ncbi:rhodanese-like domain-containing protein [Jatrophihabitans sp. YIM 134969]
MTAVAAPPALYASVEELLAAARGGLPRLGPGAAAEAVRRGALLVDIRPAWQRGREGEIPGAVVVERNHLEWRLHPGSSARLPQAVAGQEWVVVCSEGYTSSLAAAALRSLGLPATDLDGGFHAWSAAGLPVTPADSPATPVEHVVPARTPPHPRR